LGYHLKRSLTSGGGYVTIYEGTGTSFTDSENVIGQIYYYVVTAYNNSGESPVSSEVNSQTLVPDAPTSPVSTASYYQSQLSWSAPAVCSSPDSYNIYRSLTSGSGYSLIGNTSDATYNDSGLTAGIEYFYVITAVKGGIEGAQSSEVSDTPTSLDAPTTPAATPGYYNNALTWDSVSGATGYNIKRATVTGGPYTLIGRSETNSFTDSKLRYDTTYFYIITSTVNGGESLASTEVSGQPNQATLSGYSPAPMSVGGGDINFTGTGFNSSQGGQIAYGTPTVYVGVTYNSDGSITATLDSGFTPGVFNMYYVVASDLNISTTNHIAVTFA
jgi:fibronectin type 3 domain-containing protein